MSHHPTWSGLAQGLLVLGMLWWAWAGYAWLTSVIDPEEGAVRLVIFGAMAALLIVSLCVPEAFGSLALTFAARLRRRPRRPHRPLHARQPRGRRPAPLGPRPRRQHRGRRRPAGRRLALRRPRPGGALAAGAAPRHGRALLLRLRRLETRPRPLRRAPRADRDHRPRRVDRRDRRRRLRRTSTSGSAPPRCSASPWPRRCGGSTSTSSRSSPPAASARPSPAGCRTRWPATPTPTSTW